MADIELVIKIPEEDYKKAIEFGHLDMCGIELAKAVLNGTPLPEGHGDLKDTKAILDEFNDTYNSKVGIVPDNLAEGFVQCEKLIKTATTLIKADKESEVEK